MKEFPTKWYLRRSSVIFALIMFGPFAYPLLWKSPRFNRTWKVSLTIGFTVATVYLLWKTWDLYVLLYDLIRQMQPV